MKKIISVLFVLVVCIVTGCASVPMASLEEDSNAKQFQVAKEKSSIYLYRNENFGGAIPLTVSIDDQVSGQTAPYTFYKWEVAPGEHLIKSFAEDVSSLLLVAKAGQAHFVRQEVKMGMWTARSQLYEVSVSEGKDAINECKMAMSKINTVENNSAKSDSTDVEKLKLQLEIEKLKLEQQKLKSSVPEVVSEISAGKQ